MIENKNYQNSSKNLYDDGNIPEVDLPAAKYDRKTKNTNEEGKNKNVATEIELPGRMRATDIIPDEVPGRSGPGGE